MDEFIFIGLLILVLLGIPTGIGLLLYFVPKRLGYTKTAKYLTAGYGILVLTVTLFVVFEDQLFTKHSAHKLISEQGIVLNDEFEIVHNESMSAFGDYYHTFTLRISESDKQKAITQIKKSKNFRPDNSSGDYLPYLSDNRYFGPKMTQNYETENAFVREYFKPSGQKGYAPTFRRISIKKETKELIFEDIDD
jgi:hypothetical protein|tara:strand:+ start:29 stop:607 length:579 start_codon:yes stop_codon:yes gene_type:complete